MEKKKECRVTTRGKVKTVDGFRGPRHAAGMIFWVMYFGAAEGQCFSNRGPPGSAVAPA